MKSNFNRLNKKRFNKAKLRFEKKLCDKHEDRDNYFKIIEDAKDLLPNNKDWWV